MSSSKKEENPTEKRKVQKDKKRSSSKKTKSTQNPKKKEIPSRKDSDLEDIIHELQVYQLELEAQNQELRQARLRQEVLAKQFSDLYDFAPIGYLTLDKEGIIHRTNLAFSSMMGTPRKFLYGKNLFSRVIYEDRDILFLHLRRLFKTQNKQNCRLRLKNKKGSVFHAQIASSLSQDERDRLTTMTSVADVTDQVLAQEAVKESEEKFRTLAENAPDIIARFDNKLRHIYVNNKTAEVLGIPKKEIIGKTNRDLGYSEELLGFWKEKISEVFSKKKKVIIEYLMEVAEGKRNFESSLVPEFDEKGDVVSVLGITRDVTHFKKNEQKIRELNKRLKQKALDLKLLNKELESFTYSVSHDLRAPLRSIKGFTEALKEDYSEHWPDEEKDYLRRIIRASDRMTHLIDSLLELSRLSQKELEVEKVDLSQMVRNFSSGLQDSHPERKVKFVIKEGLEVWGDSQLMNAALQNLIRNAWKFTKHCPKARIEFGVSNQKKEKTFFVRDNGVGFDMFYSHKLFTPFQRLHSSSDFPGAGVGLSTVQRIILRHNGRIWAEAEEGKGATFYFTLKQKGE